MNYNVSSVFTLLINGSLLIMFWANCFMQSFQAIKPSQRIYYIPTSTFMFQISSSVRLICSNFSSSLYTSFRSHPFVSRKGPHPELHQEAQLQQEAHGQVERVKSAYEQQQEQQRLEAQRAEERRQIQMRQDALQAQRERVLKEREQRLKQEQEREEQQHREADRREQLLREEHQRSDIQEISGNHLKFTAEELFPY